MVKAGGLVGPAMLSLAISVSLASSVEARDTAGTGITTSAIRANTRTPANSGRSASTRTTICSRARTSAVAAARSRALSPARGLGLAGGRARQVAVRCDRADRATRRYSARRARRVAQQRRGDCRQLTSECPREISAPLSAQLDNVVQGIDTTVAALDAVRPALQNFYGTLEDEQKAQLLVRGRPTVEAQAQVQERSSRSERRRVFNGGPAPTPHPLGAVCEQLCSSASLRDWPIRQMESDMRLSDPQRRTRSTNSLSPR